MSRDLLRTICDVPIRAALTLGADRYAIGDRVAISCELSADQDLPVMVDYRIRFARGGGKTAEKVFKLKVAEIKAGRPLSLSKAHFLKGGATTFTLYPGPHEVVLQVNGQDLARATFDLTASS